MKIQENKQSDFMEKVTKGLKISYEKLIKIKIERNQSIVIMREGKIITIKASELHKL